MPMRAAQIFPLLSVSDGNEAIAFYSAAFDAKVIWQMGSGEDVLALLSIHGAKFFIASQVAGEGTNDTRKHKTVRFMIVEDPIAMCEKAIAAGAVDFGPLKETVVGNVKPHLIERILQASVLDPYGHLWLLGKPIESLA